MDMEKIDALTQENEALKQQNELYVSELKACRSEISRQIELAMALKKEMRRYEVQLNSLKAENDEFKNKFARIENNMVGKAMLQGYRWLREMKRRRG